MAQEDFSMRILPTGEIILELDGLPEKRIRDLLEYIEETLGPVRIINTGGEDDGGVRLRPISEEEAAEDTDKDRHRLRLREDG